MKAPQTQSVEAPAPPGAHDDRGSLGRVAHRLRFDRSVWAKALRFCLVGGVSGVIFAATTTLLISQIGLDERLSSAIGYVVSMPVNFFANRSFSFRSQGRMLSDAVRYSLLHVFNICITTAAMEASISAFHLHYLFGVAGAIVLVPAANFLIMNTWVFGRRPQTLTNPPD